MLRSLVGSEMCIRDRIPMGLHPQRPPKSRKTRPIWKAPSSTIKKIKQEKREYNRLLAKCTPANIGAALAAEIQADFSQVPYELSESESEAENPSDVLPSPAGYNKPPDHDEDPPSTGITVVCSSCSSALANQAVKY